MPKSHSASKPRYASIIRRIVANILDSLILSLIQLGLFFSLGGSFETLKVPTGGPISIRVSLSFFVSLFYVLGFWVMQNGQTLGKRIMHIRIVTDDNKKIDWFSAFVRYLGYWVSAIPLGLGYIWAIFDPKKQAWHDKMAKTYVVESDREEPSKIAYAIGCIIPIFYLIIFLTFVGLGIFAGIKGLKQKRQTVSSYQQSVNDMSAEAKIHFDRSQELFSQMRASADRNTTRKLNDENISELKKALAIEPNNARLWSDLGSAYTWVSTNGTLADGLAAYGKAEELDPNNAIYATNVGDMLTRLGKYQEAILQLQRAIRLNSEYAYPEYLIGVSYKNLRIYDEARTHLERAIEIYTEINDNGEHDDDILLAQQQLAGLPK